MLPPSLLRRLLVDKTNIRNWISRTLRPSPLDNVAYNRDFWNRYASHWDRTTVLSEDASEDTCLEFLGDEWGTKAAVASIVQNFIFPYITQEHTVAEIGPGGGRISSLVVQRVKKLVCYDISDQMLKRLAAALSAHSNVEYIHLQEIKFEAAIKQFDFIYSFDVFVHLDLHTIWKYLLEIQAALKVGGRVFLHTANITAPGGWARFTVQERYDPIGFYFVTPELVRYLASKAGLVVIKESQPTPENFYLNRDYLVVLEKAG